MKNVKKLSRRGLSLFLALVMCMGMLQIPAFANEAGEVTEGSTVVTTDAEQPTTPPDATGEEPAGTPEVITPAEVEQQPTEGEQQPAEVEQQPAEVEQQPTEGEQQPAEGEQQPAEGEQQPAEGEQQPTEGEQQPAEGEQQPAEGEQQPAEGEQQPAEGEQQPAEGEQQPAEGEQQPAEGEQQPAEGEQQPAEGEQQPATGDSSSSEPAGNPFDPVEAGNGAVDPMLAELKVQAFLTAVNALPAAEDVTPENAEAIGEQVNKVLDMYEGLIDAGLDEREDVTEVLETVYAVFEAVLAAEEIEDGVTFENSESSRVVTSADSEAYPQTSRYNVCGDGWSDNWAETGYGQIELVGKGDIVTDDVFMHYYRGHNGVAYPLSYTNLRVESNSNSNAVRATVWQEGGHIKVQFEQLGTGAATIVIGYTCQNMKTTVGLATDSDWYCAVSGQLVYTVNGSDDSSVNVGNIGETEDWIDIDLGTGYWTLRNANGLKDSGYLPDSPVVSRYYYSNTARNSYGQTRVTYPGDLYLYSVENSDGTIATVDVGAADDWNTVDRNGNHRKGPLNTFTAYNVGTTDIVVTTVYDIVKYNYSYYGGWSGYNAQDAYIHTYHVTVTDSSEDKITLTYHDGDSIIAQVTGEPGQYTIGQNLASKEGYVFKGWSDTEGGTTVRWEVGKTYTFTENTDLWAVWEKVQDEQKATYQIIREYWVDGELKETVKIENLLGKVDDEIVGDELEAKYGWAHYTLNGETTARDFTYDGSTPEKLVLVAGDGNTITLKYHVGQKPVTPETTKLVIVKNFVGVDAIPENFAIEYTLDGKIVTLNESNKDADSTGLTLEWTITVPKGTKLALTEKNADVQDKTLTVTVTGALAESVTVGSTTVQPTVSTNSGSGSGSGTTGGTTGGLVVEEVDDDPPDVFGSASSSTSGFVSGSASTTVTVLPSITITNTYTDKTPGPGPGPGPGTDPVKNGITLVKKINGEDKVELTVANRGEELTYTITVTNNTNVTLANMLIRDKMPDGVSLVENSGSVTVNGKPGTVTVTETGVYHDWKVAGTVADKAVVVLTYKAVVTGEGAVNAVNTAKAFAKRYEPTGAATVQGMTQALTTFVMARGFVSGGSGPVGSGPVGSGNTGAIETPEGYGDQFESNEDNATVTAPAAPAKPTHTVTVRYMCDVNKNSFSDKVVHSYTLAEGEKYDHSVDSKVTTYPSADGFNSTVKSPVWFKTSPTSTNTWVYDEILTTDALTGTMGDQDIVIEVWYTKDNKGTDPNDPTKDTSDGTPDKYQAKVVYTATEGGSQDGVNRYETIMSNGKMATEGTISIVGATATPDGSHYFVNWTAAATGHKDWSYDASTSATLAGFSINDAKGGAVYTFTANFEAKTALTIEIVGNTNTVTYNGQEQSVTGYAMTVKNASGEEITLPAGLTVTPASADSVAKGTEARETAYPMGLTQDGFGVTGDNAGKYTVTFTVTDGWLKINPVTVQPELDVTAGDVTTTYDGQGHPVTEVVVNVDNKPVTGATVTITYVDENGNAVDVPTDAGKYTATITATKDGKSDSTTATVTIAKKTLTVTTDSASKTYDGTALTAPGRIDGLVGEETVTFAVTGTQTEVGNSSNTYTLTWDGTAKEGNYAVTEETIGTLTVTERTYTVTYDLNGGTSSETLVYPNLSEGTATPRITNPTRSGYTFTGWTPAVADTVTGDVTYVAQWSRNSTGGGGGGGGNRPTPTPDPDPETPPVVDVPDPDVPLVEVPEVDPPLVDVPEVDPPLVDVPDVDVPLVDIPDEDVPLADIPKTDDLSLLWHASALLSAAGLMVLAALERKQRREK